MLASPAQQRDTVQWDRTGYSQALAMLQLVTLILIFDTFIEFVWRVKTFSTQVDASWRVKTSSATESAKGKLKLILRGSLFKGVIYDDNRM